MKSTLEFPWSFSKPKGLMSLRIDPVRVFVLVLKKGIDAVEGSNVSIHPVRSDAPVLHQD